MSPSPERERLTLFPVFVFFRHFFAPGKGAKYGLFGPTDFFSAAHACRVVRAKKKKRVTTKKTPKISKKLSPAASDTVKGPCNHNGLYLWHRGSIHVGTI